MLTQIAWRNVWRNPLRSFVVIGAIALGVWAGIFMTGFATGMMKSYIDNAITNIYSHIQIHDPRHGQEMDVEYPLPDLDHLQQRLAASENISAYCLRSLVFAMIASAQSAQGIKIKGVDPESEELVSGLSKRIVEGVYFEENRKNSLLMSRRLAEKLDVGLRSKVVLTFQDLAGNITAASFRVSGLFELGNTPFEESHVFVKREDLNRLLLTDSAQVNLSLAHEVAIMVKNPEQLDLIVPELKKDFAKYLTQSYREVAPDLQLYESQMTSVSSIYLTVIMMALIFGIINTMLMAILERYRELGVLMAVGMNKVKVFFMVVMETVFLCLAAAPIGLGLAFLTIWYFGLKGMNLSAYSSTLRMFGMSEIIYLEVDPSIYWQAPLFIAFTAVVSSIYPARKAIKLKPVEAIRKI